MLGVAETLVPKSDLEALSIDTYENGYKIIAIEYHYLRLNKADTVADLETGQIQDFKKITNKGKFLPLPFKSSHGVSQHRASEFAKKYHCQRIYSKVDHKKLGFPDNLIARIGTAGHALANRQHLPRIHENDILEELDLAPLTREENCEVGLLFHYNDIAVSAHADALMQYLPNSCNFGSAVGEISVLDMKRKKYSTYEEWGHKLQLAANVLGAEESLQTGCENFWLMTSKRPRKEVRGRYRMPEYHVTKVKRDGIVYNKFISELVETHHRQAELLYNREAWNKNKKLLEDNGTCKDCFDKDVCDFTTSVMNFRMISMAETLTDVLEAVLPNKELPAQ